MADEPYAPNVVKSMVLAALASESYLFSKHANEELAKDGLTPQDAVNVLRGGTVMPGEMENRSWRYRIRTPKIVVVIAFQAARVRVVTAWRL